MITKKSPLVSVFILFLLFFALLPLQKTAAQEVGIKISPVILEELVDPGQVIARQIKVTNESEISRTFYVSLRDFGAEGESGQAKLLPPGTDYGFSIASWIDITSEGIDVGPNEEKIINYRIAIPEDAGPGGYRGAILLGVEPPRLQIDSEDKGAGMSIAQQAASLVLLQVKGEVNEDASVREFNTDKDYYGAPFSVNFLVRVENEGNVHVKPHGAIRIENMFGKEVAVVRVNEKGGNILPGSVRRFDNILWEGKNAFGKYTATLGLSYGTEVDAGGNGKSSIISVKTFWIIPWRIIVPVSLSLLLFFVIMFFVLRLYRNRAVKRAMESAGISHTRYTKRAQAPSPVAHLMLILFTSFVVLLIVFTLIYIFFLS